MIFHRALFASRSLVAQLSRLSLKLTPTLKPVSSAALLESTAPCAPWRSSPYSSIRFFSLDDGKGGDHSKNEDDPFGMHFEDGVGGLGPTLPPLYQRDTTTGRFTGEIVPELSDAQKRILAADPVEKDAMLLDSVEKHWKKAGQDEAGQPAELNRLGARIRQSDMATNVLGRSVKAQAAAEELDDGSELGRDESGFSQHLTKEEFRTFSEYMKKKHKVDVSEEDIPVQENKSARTKKAATEEDPENLDLSLKWLTARAQRQTDDSLDDNPYSDLMPGDLSPNRVVNRKHAKQIPVKLLHHNNLALLQNYISPTGQIRNRVQTRLGARDQRRVARLIKRSRALGLIPYLGQFKAEQHGWVHAPDIHKDRKWENQLEQRGLVIKKSAPKNKQEE
jgi:ribosomal protein S18